MSEAPQQSELSAVRSEVEAVLQSVHEFDEQIEERNTKRLLLIENLRELLPEDQFNRFKDIIDKTIEAVKTSPDESTIPPLTVDESNPLESLRKIRCQIAQEVCEVMGVDSPQL